MPRSSQVRTPSGARVVKSAQVLSSRLRSMRRSGRLGERAPASEEGRAGGEGDRAWGKAEGGVRAQRAKTASPDWRGGVGADEIALAWLEELTAGDLGRSGHETSDRRGREVSALLQTTDHGPFTQVDLV